jgi:PAS domain S-box-containing protein
VWESGTDGGCTYFNEGWLSFSGRSLEAELGDGWITGVHPDDRDACLREYTEAFAARRDFQLEYRLCRHDGTYRWVRNIGTPRWSPNGSFLGYVGCALDVTRGRHLPLQHDWVQTLTVHLRSKRLLLILDNCEHVLRAVPFSSDRTRLDGWMTITRRRLGKDAFENEWQYRQQLEIDEAVALAGSVQPSDNEIKSTTNLTRRERQVAALLARGLTNKGIGAELVISPATVGVHIEHILSKLGLHSRAQAAVWAVNGGLAASEK